MNKIVGKILAEDIVYEGDEAEKIHRQVQLLKDNLEDFLQGGRVEPSSDFTPQVDNGGYAEEEHTVM